MTEPELEESIRAFAHPGRRAMLQLVWDQERPASDLADEAGLSKSAASQHLKLLREAGLVTVRADGTRRLYRADLDRVAEVAGFLDEFWASPLARLKTTAEAEIEDLGSKEAGVKLVAQELVIQAPAEQLYELLVDPELFVQWMAEDATLDPVPGGTIRWTHANGDTCSGTYIELVPGRRVVFTYGWERAEVQIPPGSTTVEIDLFGRPDGTTLLRLVHRGLEDRAADAHRGGWSHYLGRLRATAEGEPPGADPFADRRVPTPEELAAP